MLRLATFIALLCLVSPGSSAQAQREVGIRRSANDLAAFAQGTYFGDVISDARGSSRSGVRVSIVRTGPNEVEIKSDYARIPTVRIRLEQAMSAIVAAGGDHVFLINRDQEPDRLELTIDDASLSLRRR